MATQGPIVLAAGGTGGHLFPAQALAEELAGRDHALALLTDRRGGDYSGALGAIETHQINAASPSGGLVTKLRGLISLAGGVFQARALLRRLRPSAVVGFGGYPSVPTVLAAANAHIPTVIHEQNAVMGRANRLLVSRADRIATSFDSVARLGAHNRKRASRTGNPVRAAIGAIGALPYPALEPGGRLNLLVLGGSLGATVMSRVVPAALILLEPEQRARIHLVQQCRAEDIDAVRATYDEAGIRAELATFFDDMAQRLGAAHLIICRAGASTVAELPTAGRPAILVPYPHATDDHQTANAKALTLTDGAWLMAEPDFTTDTLCARLQSFLETPETLTKAASRLAIAARPEAAKLLADLVEALADGDDEDSMEGQREAAA